MQRCGVVESDRRRDWELMARSLTGSFLGRWVEHDPGALKVAARKDPRPRLSRGRESKRVAGAA